jgi:hypothetical protein
VFLWIVGLTGHATCSPSNLKHHLHTDRATGNSAMFAPTSTPLAASLVSRNHGQDSYYSCFVILMIGIAIGQLIASSTTATTTSGPLSTVEVSPAGLTYGASPSSHNESGSASNETSFSDNFAGDFSAKVKSLEIITNMNDQIMCWIVPVYTVLVVLYLVQHVWSSVSNVVYRLGLGRSSSRFSITPAVRRMSAKARLRLSSTRLDRSIASSDEKRKLLPSELDSGAASSTAGVVGPAPVDLTGVYKLVKNVNFEEFLAAQDIPWALRRAAAAARPTHRIAHDTQTHTITIKIEGIIESQTTYVINGPPAETNVRGRVFHDTVRYLNPATEGLGILVMKKGITEVYDCTVQRMFTKPGDRSEITMINTVTFRDGSKASVQCQQTFQRLESEAQ